MRRLLSLLFAFGLTVNLALASDQDPPTVTVDAMAHTADGFTVLQQQALEAFNGAIQTRGLDQPSERKVSIFVDAVESDHTEMIALSVTVFSELPEEVITLASETEAFYLASRLDREDLPGEGAHVRRAISEDWIREYRMIQNHSLLIIDPAELRETAEAIVAAL